MSGDVTVAHVEVLAGAVRRREALYPEHEDTLLNAASSLTPDDLVTVAKRWRSLADDQLAAVDAAAAHEQRFFHVSPTFGGGRIDGFVDPTGTATLICALDALVPPDPAGTPDPRPLSVRRADALVMLAEQWLAAPERAGRASCTLNVVVDVDTLLGKASLDAGGARCDLDRLGTDRPGDRGTPRVRREGRPHRDGRKVPGPRPRALDPGRQPGAPPGRDDPRPALPGPGLPDAGDVVRRAPHRPLARRR